MEMWVRGPFDYLHYYLSQGLLERIALDNGVSMDFAERSGTITPQHYAFLIGEDDFDAVLERIHAKKLEHWADPGRQQPGEINRNDGGRGVYFEDPDGHLLELLTRPYGSGA